MTLKKIYKRQNIYLIERYYATGSNNEPDYSISLRNREPRLILKRHKNKEGELSHDEEIDFTRLPKEVKEFIKIN